MVSKIKGEMPVWWEWAVFGEDGFVAGVADDAPPDVKKAYKEYLEAEKEIASSGKAIPK